VLAVLLVVSMAQPALAWNEPGHMVIGAIAYDILAKDDLRRDGDADATVPTNQHDKPGQFTSELPITASFCSSSSAEAELGPA
jgi:hypothetical protein